jgi:hypothetical protein
VLSLAIGRSPSEGFGLPSDGLVKIALDSEGMRQETQLVRRVRRGFNSRAAVSFNASAVRINMIVENRPSANAGMTHSPHCAFRGAK